MSNICKFFSVFECYVIVHILKDFKDIWPFFRYEITFYMYTYANMLYVCNMAQRVKLFQLLLLFFFYEQVLLNSVADGFVNAKGINSACVRKQIIVEYFYFFFCSAS